MSWTAEGHLLASNGIRLFKLEIDGKNQTQLLNDSGATILNSTACGTSYLVLNWLNHSGAPSWGIWRTDADGANPRNLTDNRSDSFPVCSPDQKWVYYLQDQINRIYRVPLNGPGKTEIIFDNTCGPISRSTPASIVRQIIGVLNFWRRGWDSSQRH